ncbi:SDR family NAD(P)-dependent oxidoreductase [Paraburkholderia sp. HP33-1]|uniref:SDR family NAD(P)-dependent oxidoreductase n=1 Tax=Paraburkholderia sp. HP33-1 TaxID=2883243 RepID=UPI001F3618C8|nr:SDR family oxidoreductase [Paraburkholderia sp. HP33-1]
MLLKDKVAVVTGAAQGIGRALVERFSAEGARVAVVDIDERGAQTAAQIEAQGGRAMFVHCDITRRASVNEAAAEIKSKLGPIDILVNNAGNIQPAMLHKMTDEQWDSVIAVHLNGSFYWLQAVVADMMERRWGRIIFSSSSTAQNGSIGQINYAAAKSGMLGMVRTAARELGKYNILVNAVAPAATTDMTKTIREDPKFAEQYAAALKAHPLRRSGEPEEVARGYLFLASDLSSFVTGQVLSVDGGSMLVR